MYGEGTSRPVILCDPEKGAKQSFKDECDINKILARHKAGGVVTHVNDHVGRFADVSRLSDYRTAIEQVRSAEAVFKQLGAAVREEFDNSAAVFLDALADPGRAEDLRELGLLPLIEALEVDVVDPPVPDVVPDAE